jgi:hypothetical protein
LMVAFLGGSFCVKTMGYLMAIQTLSGGLLIRQIEKFSAPPLVVRGMPIATIHVASPYLWLRHTSSFDMVLDPPYF